MASSSPEYCSRVDNTFQVHASSCRGGFDFTLLFEELILGVLPIGAILLVMPFRIYQLIKSDHKVLPSKRTVYKTSAWLSLAIVQLLQTIIWALPGADRTRVSIAANAIIYSGTFALCLPSYIEHTRTVRPSLMLDLYLIISLLFDAAKTRTLWLRQSSNSNHLIAILSSFGVGIKLVLLFLESWQKRRILKIEYRDYPPEALANTPSRAFFWWLNPLFVNGFSKSLRVEDLPVLDKKLDSRRLRDQLDGNWKSTNKNGNHSLLLTMFKTLKWPLLAVVPPRACLILLLFCQPILLGRAMELSTANVTDESTNVGYGLIGAYVLVYVGMAIMMSQHQHLTYRAITMMRGALVSLIYKKASNMSTKDADPASSMTLMSADVERIVMGWHTMHEIWANAVEISVAVVLLKQQLGVACAVPIGVAVFALVGSLVAMSGVMAQQAKWLEAIERRISSTSAMLGSIKGIKILGLKPTMITSIQSLRIDELVISKAFRKLLVWNMAFAWTTRIFAPTVSFAAFVGISPSEGNGSSLAVSKVYTSLSLFALLADPFLSLVMALMSFLGSVGSFVRIQTFLKKDSHEDSRKSAHRSSHATLIGSGALSPSSGHSSVLAIVAEIPQSLKKLSLPAWDILMLEAASFLSFSLLVGPSGCGKSTLLKAMLGEVPCLGGRVELSSESVAYCDQTPWHMNGTIRESITALSPFDSNWYASVINACALEEDLAQFPKRDQAVIGSKGVALSGGQSQRIALARAIYARKRILILDDVFSGLDTTTENQIFHSLLGTNGILRQAGTTVLVASSSVKRLAYADYIAVLEPGGQISERGTYQELSLKEGYVSSFSLPPPDWNYTTETKAMSPSARPDYSSEQKIEWSSDDLHKHTGEFATYSFYLRSIGWFPTTSFLIAIAGFAFCISFPSIWLKWWAAAEQKEPGKDTEHYLGIYFMLGGLAMVGLMVGTWQIVVSAVPKSGERFHKNLLETVLSAPMLFLSTTDSGSILNRFSQDLQLIDMELPIAGINVAATLFLCIAQMALVGVASVYAAASFPIVLLILYIIQKIYLRTSRQLRLLEIEAKAPLFSHFTNCLNGLVTMRAFGWRGAMEEKNLRLLEHSQRPFYYLYAVQRWLTLTLDLVVAGIATVLIVLVVALRGTLSSGYVGVALFNVILFSQTIKLLVQFWTNMEIHIGSVARVKDFTEKVESEDLPTENNLVPPAWPSEGVIEFRSVSASYRASEYVLKDVSLSIQAGEKVGICGRTGSGKSSLMLSIFRMIELNSGIITIDGLDISSIPRQEIRSRLNGVSQDSVFIKGSVRLNADPIGASSDKAIWDALNSVQLLSVVQEKGGLDTDVDNLHLSHGQRQLFCLVRAILHPSKILVLDEATSNVDTKTDETMQRIIREKFCNHTIIAVAHKLDTILDYDKAVVLDAGRAIECDDPYTLLTQESAFSKLYASSMVEDAE